MAEKLIQNCTNCGAIQNYDTGQATLTCTHCGTQNVIERPELIVPKVMESEWIVPARVDEVGIQKLTYKYMSLGKHTPDDMIETAQITLKEIFYVPTYLFSGDYDAKWTATFGYDRQEPYTAYRNVTYTDRNGQTYTRQEPYTAYRTVTDWRPMNGTDAGTFNVQTYSGPRIDERILTLIEQTNLKNITEFKREYISGFELKEISITPDQSYRADGERQVNRLIDIGVRSHAQGDRQRDWYWTANINKQHSNVVMPIAHSVFEYDNKEFHIWFDGDEPSQSIGDRLPEDSKRKNAINLGFLPFGIAMLTTAICAATQHVNTAISVIIGVASLVYGFARRSSIISHSQQKRDSLLMQKDAESSTNEHLTPEELQKLTDSYSPADVPGLAKTANDSIVIPFVSIICVIPLVVGGFVAPNVSDINYYGNDGQNLSSTENSNTPDSGNTEAVDPNANLAGDGSGVGTTDSTQTEVSGSIGDQNSDSSNSSTNGQNNSDATGSIGN
jgi:hypothetical protein